MAVSISERIFGDDIPDKVKDKLKNRQEISLSGKTIFANEEVLKSSTNFGGLADASSRTPIARMWTAVQVVKAAPFFRGPVEKSFATREDAQKEMDSSDPQGAHKLFIKTKDGKFFIKMEVPRSAPKIYTIGNNSLGTVFPASGITDERGAAVQELMPTVWKSNENEFMKPEAGITSISSETVGPTGATQSTTVNFIVSNNADFDQIYSKYFLRHGAQMFIDFGWDSVQQLYDPASLIKDELRMNETLYGENGYITNQGGDAETIIGYVKDFNAKVTSNGSWECTIELISGNGVLLDNIFSSANKNRLKHILDISILQYLSSAFGGGVDKWSDDGLLVSTLKDAAEEISFAKKSVEAWLEAYQTFAAAALKTTHRTVPGDAAVKWGVYYTEDDTERNLFVSIAFLEDKILNREFAFGSSEEDVTGELNKNKPTKNELRPRFNSISSFMSWNENLYKKQLYSESPESFKFLYPENWDYSYDDMRGNENNRIGNQSKKSVATYKVTEQVLPGDGTVPSEYYSREKYNQAKAYSDNPSGMSTYGMWAASKKHEYWSKNSTMKEKEIGDPIAETYTLWDKREKRIPVRELFISVEIIKEGINRSNNSGEFINFILKQINEASGEIFNLKLIANNYAKNTLAIADIDALNDPAIDELFEFHPFSKGSIITDLDLAVIPPTGGLGNKIAIDTLGAGESIIPVDRLTDLSIAEMSSFYEDGVPGVVGVAFLPNQGRYRLDRLKTDISIDSLQTINFSEGDELLGGKSWRSNSYLEDWGTSITESEEKSIRKAVKKAIDYDQETWYEQGQKQLMAAFVGDDDKDNQDAEDEFIEDMSGGQLASSVSHYYHLLAINNHFGTVPTLMPVSVDLSIKGISGLLPGSLFRMSYLPRRYSRNSIFQVFKVSHDVGSTWTTSIEAKMRLNKKIKTNQYFPYEQKPLIYLSKSALKSRPFMLTNIENVFPFISSLRVEDIIGLSFQYISWVFNFTARKEGRIKIPRLKMSGIGKQYGYVTRNNVVSPTEAAKFHDKIQITKTNMYKLIINKSWWTVVKPSAYLRNFDKQVGPWNKGGSITHTHMGETAEIMEKWSEQSESDAGGGGGGGAG